MEVPQWYNRKVLYCPAAMSSNPELPQPWPTLSSLSITALYFYHIFVLAIYIHASLHFVSDWSALRKYFQ